MLLLIIGMYYYMSLNPVLQIVCLVLSNGDSLIIKRQEKNGRRPSIKTWMNFDIDDLMK